VTVHLLGIRHHGPGSARAVRAALERIRPDTVLIEGPPEADALVPFVGSLTPPVALLCHAVDEPGRAAFWPFADFSPEWQALRWAVEEGVPVRFIDLPATVSLALPPDKPSGVSADPLKWLSEASGHEDPERWWEDVVEHRLGGDPLELFAAVADAMGVLRAEGGAEESPRDLVREARMRQGIRAAAKAGSVAVVCGAWHAPALAVLGPATADATLLRGLPKTKVHTAWVPWTSERLAQASGYGAGVASPGWYAHLFRTPDLRSERWVARVCALLREEDLPASPASAVETVRLAETLAALRGRALPGLTELMEATETVLCEGARPPMAVISRRLVMGEELGEVGDDVPTVPLQADVERTWKKLRFTPTAGDREVELDLRKDTDLARSRLLHRLSAIGVAWGELRSTRGTGTFKEGWHLRWRPEFAVALIEKAHFGTTLEAATTAFLVERAGAAEDLRPVTALVETVIMAELPAAMEPVAAALERCSARTGDVRLLMDALPPLARVLRYGDVRRSNTAVVRGVVDALLVRICAGLASGVQGLDDDAAALAVAALEGAEESIALVAAPEQVPAWRMAQLAVADSAGAPGLLGGRCARLLLDAGVVDAEDAGARLARALSDRVRPGHAVAWIEGFLRGSGALLLRDEQLWSLLDSWLDELRGEAFDEALPLLRRAFAEFPRPERRAMGEKVARGPSSPAAPAAPESWDAARVALVLPVLEAVFGRG
jgi:hypothetical protein